VARPRKENRISDALYRKQHWLALKLKHQMYGRLPHVKEKRRGTRKEYQQEYYKKNRAKILKRVSKWGRENKNKKRLHNKKYKEKIKQKELEKKKKLNANQVRADRVYRLRDVYKAFLEYCKDKYHPTTIRLTKTNMNHFFDYLNILKEKGMAIKYIYGLDRDFITRYVAYVKNEAVSKGAPLNYSKKKSRLSVLRVFLRFCQRKGYLKQDLRRFVIMPKYERKVEDRLLTVEEMEGLLEAPDTNTTLGIRDRAILELSYSGFRSGEMLHLKLEHVDLVDNRVFILNAKGDKERVVPMTAEAIYWIKRWLARRHEFIKDKEKSEYLFITHSGIPLERQNFSRSLKKYAKEANIPPDVIPSPHDLRRITATHLVKFGKAPILQVSGLLGHDSIKTTQRYLRLSDEDIKEEYVKSHPSNKKNRHYGKI